MKYKRCNTVYLTSNNQQLLRHVEENPAQYTCRSRSHRPQPHPVSRCRCATRCAHCAYIVYRQCGVLFHYSLCNLYRILYGELFFGMEFCSENIWFCYFTGNHVHLLEYSVCDSLPIKPKTNFLYHTKNKIITNPLTAAPKICSKPYPTQRTNHLISSLMIRELILND